MSGAEEFPDFTPCCSWVYIIEKGEPLQCISLGLCFMPSLQSSGGPESRLKRQDDVDTLFRGPVRS